MRSSNIGGQAVMEGIMMRHKDKYSIAVRRPDQEIELKVEDYKCIFGNHAFLKKPIIRGVVSFVDSLVVGTKCLMYSAEIAGDEEDEETARKNEQLTEEERSAKKAKEDKQFKWLLYITVATSMVVSVAAFMFLPYVLASLIRGVGASEFLVTIMEAFVKLALFMGYMFLISRMKDIQRTFMYHGAEHKCINCVEHGLPLTVENVLKSSRLHKRCGTSFLFLVMLVSIVLHFVFVAVPFYWVRLLGRLLMVPVVAGISFEIIQWAGRTDSKFAGIMSKPGLAMQKFTTKEPTADMAEVAIKAGVGEIDMVINVGLIKSNKWDAVKDDIQAVLTACHGVPLKVILETCLLTKEEIMKACEICKALGVAFVKTSTGFNKGGATVEDVALMKKTVGNIGVKASGGIRDTQTALAMIEAGATRIGASAGIAIVTGVSDNTSSNY